MNHGGSVTTITSTSTTFGTTTTGYVDRKSRKVYFGVHIQYCIFPDPGLTVVRVVQKISVCLAGCYVQRPVLLVWTK